MAYAGTITASPPVVDLPALSPTPPPASPPSTSTISQNSLIQEGESAFRRKNYQKAHDLLEEAFLDTGAGGLSPETLLDLASSSRHIGHSASAISLLLPLLSTGRTPPLSESEALRARYELGMADAGNRNRDGAVRQILPIFSRLNGSSQIRHAVEVLMDYWRQADPVSGTILMGQSLWKLEPHDQKAVMTHAIELVFTSVHDETGLLKILSSFPRDFPGDYASYRLGVLYDKSRDPWKAERILLRVILYYPESMYIGEAERLLDKLSPVPDSRTVGLILPDMTKYPLRPYMRSILTGVVLGLQDGGSEKASLIVRFVLKHDTFAGWYQNLVDKEKIVALVGPVLSRDYESVRKRIKDDQLLAVTPSLSGDERLPFMISMASPPEMVSGAMATFALSLAPKARVAILYPKDPYGHIFMKSFQQAIVKGGGRATASLPIRPGNRDDQNVVAKLRRFGQEVVVSKAGPLPSGVTSRSGDFVSYNGKSYFLVYRNDPGDPSFFLPDFDVIALPNDSTHPFKVLDELVYKDIQNVIVIGNETFMTSKKTWDVVSDIHNPLYSVAPVNLFRIIKGHPETPSNGAYFRIGQLSGKSPNMLTLQSYDCAHFLKEQLSGGFTTRYHLAVTAMSRMSYEGLSGRIGWGREGVMTRVFSLYQFSGGDWKPVASETVTWHRQVSGIAGR